MHHLLAAKTRPAARTIAARATLDTAGLWHRSRVRRALPCRPEAHPCALATAPNRAAQGRVYGRRDSPRAATLLHEPDTGRRCRGAALARHARRRRGYARPPSLPAAPSLPGRALGLRTKWGTLAGWCLVALGMGRRPIESSAPRCNPPGLGDRSSARLIRTTSGSRRDSRRLGEAGAGCADYSRHRPLTHCGCRRAARPAEAAGTSYRALPLHLGDFASPEHRAHWKLPALQPHGAARRYFELTATLPRAERLFTPRFYDAPAAYERGGG